MKHVNFLTFFWGRKYKDIHIDILNRALFEYCNFPFTLHVLTDRNLSVDKSVQQYELWPDHKMDGRCWRRMRAFEKETMGFLGHYFALDIDILLMPGFGDLVQSVYENKITFCRSENPNYPKNPFSGTIWQVGDLDTADQLIWKEFVKLKNDPRYRPLYRLAEDLRRRGYNGSDSAVLGWAVRNMMVSSIGAADGIYSYPHHIRDMGLSEPPENAKVILFHGRENDFLRAEMAAKYDFVNEYLKKFCTNYEKAVTIEDVAKKYFNINDAGFLENLKGYTREILQK